MASQTVEMTPKLTKKIQKRTFQKVTRATFFQKSGKNINFKGSKMAKKFRKTVIPLKNYMIFLKKITFLFD
jgi:hypothetical protein